MREDGWDFFVCASFYTHDIFLFIWVSGILLDGIWAHFIMRKFKRKKHFKVDHTLLN